MGSHKEHRLGESRKALRRLGREVRAGREVMGLSQSKTARLVGCSPQTIGSIENGSCWPSLPVALRLRRVLWVSLDELTAK